ncbi:hypothetical protein [Corynebacterium kalidii]
MTQTHQTSFRSTPWYAALCAVVFYLITYVTLAVVFRTVQLDFMVMSIVPGALGYILARVFGVKANTTLIAVPVVSIALGVAATLFSAT